MQTPMHRSAVPPMTSRIAGNSPALEKISRQSFSIDSRSAAATLLNRPVRASAGAEPGIVFKRYSWRSRSRPATSFLISPSLPGLEKGGVRMPTSRAIAKQLATSMSGPSVSQGGVVTVKRRDSRSKFFATRIR